MEEYRSLLRHQDTDIRAEAVSHLVADSAVRRDDLELAELLVWVARNDPDADIRERVIECIEDRSVLADIARGDPDPHVRISATMHARDEELLKDRVEHDENPLVRDAAVAGIRDNEWLFDVIANHPDAEVRRSAIIHLQIFEPQIFRRVSPQNPRPELRAQAVRWIEDPEALFGIAKSDPDPEVRRVSAVQYIAIKGTGLDQRKLEELALDPSDHVLWEFASHLTNQEALCALVLRPVDRLLGSNIVREQLTDPGILRTIAVNSTLNDVRKEALAKIDDQPLLRDVVSREQDAPLRAEATRRITNQTFLTQLATTDGQAEVRKAAASRLTSVESLSAVAMTDADEHVRWEATWRLGHMETPEATSTLRALVETAEHGDVRTNAAFLLRDPHLRARLAVADPDRAVRLEEIEDLDDHDALVGIATNDSDAVVAMRAFDKLTGTSDAREIATVSRHAEVRYAAEAQQGWTLLLSLPPPQRFRSYGTFIYAFLISPGRSAIEIDQYIHHDIRENELRSHGERWWSEEASAEWVGRLVWNGRPGGEREVPVVWDAKGIGVATFRVPEVDYTQRAVRLTVFRGVIEIAELRNEPFDVREVMDGRSGSDGGYLSIAPHVVHGPPIARLRFFRRALGRHRIFASYAREDHAIVELIESVSRSQGAVELRWDLNILRSGDTWDETLRAEIRKADAFQLFWSHRASRSLNVEREWRYALSLNRKNFILPVVWEDQPPAFPPELAHLHFQRIALSPKPRAPL